jgi:glycosyltransferase involved in cell wall biosynthesis
VPSPESPASIAVAIPCYNEAAAVATVIGQWRQALPDAEIVIFDNNSSDGTGDIARQLGVRVETVPLQGKGYAVQAIFARLADRDAVVLVDGDGTYPAHAVPALLEPVLAGRAEMTVGARRPVAEAGAMTPVRGIGNVLIRGAFRVLIGRGPGDLLSGYRVFSRRFLNSVTLRSSGFEIETELATEAVARGLSVVEIPVPYSPRITGTESKLRAFRDGRRILGLIVAQSLRLRPERLAFLLAAVVVVVALVARSAVVGFAGSILASVGLVCLLTRVLKHPHARARMGTNETPVSRR